MQLRPFFYDPTPALLLAKSKSAASSSILTQKKNKTKKMLILHITNLNVPTGVVRRQST